MKKKSTEKVEGYALSAHSKLEGLDFSRTMVWASKIYAIFRQHEIGLCSDLIFRRLKKILLEVYATDEVHDVGHKQMCVGDVALLKKWRINNYGQWNDSLNLRLSLRVKPKVGEVVLALKAMVLEQGRLNPRCIGVGIRFYLLFLDEDKDTSSSVALLDKNGDGSFASHDKNYYWANIMEAIAIKEGVVVNYEKRLFYLRRRKK